MPTVSSISVALAVLAYLGCRSFTNEMDTKMITRNAYAESMGMDRMVSDVEACGMHAVQERARLKAELYGGDAYFASQEAKVESGQAVGREIGREIGEPGAQPGLPTSSPKSGEINTERIAGDAGAAVAGAIVDIITSDSSKHDQRMLALDLDNVKTFIRLKNACLRGKGYEVAEYAEDGARTAYVERDPFRVVLRADDGSEIVMYQQPEEAAE